MKIKIPNIDVLRKARLYSEETNEELIHNIKIIEEHININFTNVKDVNIQKYLNLFDEINLKIRQITGIVKDVADYSATLERWSIGNYDIKDIQ